MEEFITDYAKLSEKLALLGELLAKYSADSELIKKVDEGVRWAILRKTAYSLPNRPSDAGMTPEQIKTAFYRAFTDAEQSVLAELDRVVNEVDKEVLSLSYIVKEIVASLELSQNGISESFKTIEGEIEKNREGIAGCIKRSEKSGGTFAYVTDGGKDNVIQVARDSNPLSIPLRYTNGRVRVGSPVEDEDAVTLAHLRGGYLGNAGVQVLDGSLTISGDIFVGGEAKAKQLESIEVADACIIANADGVPLAELSGYVIRVTAEQAYAIVYDPIAQCVKIGLGVYDGEAKVFTFNEGEAQALATRGELADGELPVWDSEKSTFKGSGLNVDDVAKHHQRFSQKNEVANALKGSASGEVVALKDVSPLEHGLGVRVSSKNLWKYQSSIYVEGKGENFTYVDERYNLPKGMYVFSCDVVIENLNTSSTGNAVYLGVDQEDGTTSFLSVVRDQTTSGKVVVAVNLLHSPLRRITLVRHNRFTSGTVNITNIQLEKDTTATTATAYTPFVPDVGAVKVKAMGKNLCDKSVISLSGDTTLEQSIIDYLNKYPFFRHGTYTMSADVTVYPEDTAEYRFFDVNVFYDDGSNELKRVVAASPTSTPAANLRDGKARHYSITFDTDINKKLKGFRLRPLSASINTGRFCKAENIQLEFETETEYEPYIEPVEYAVNADGTVEGVKSIYPSTTLTTDTVGALIEVDYNRDINKAFEEIRKVILSLGGIL